MDIPHLTDMNLLIHCKPIFNTAVLWCREIQKMSFFLINNVMSLTFVALPRLIFGGIPQPRFFASQLKQKNV